MGEAAANRPTATAVRWSAVAVAGRQGLQLAFGVLLARLLGPANYGVIGLATLYVTMSTLLLDQGLSAALIQRQQLQPAAPGAAATLNLISGLVLAATTWVVAPLIGEFFHSAQVPSVVRALGLGLLLKAGAIAPRAMLSRRLDFRSLATADLFSAAGGALVGTVAALRGASYYSMVAQVIVTDLTLLILLVGTTRGPLPNTHLRELRPLLAFGLRIFAANGLAYFSRNTDNILVGRYLGSSSLGLYALAYRILVIPVQLLGQTVNRVLFPVFSRAGEDRKQLRKVLLQATELLAAVTLPVMSLVACSAPQFLVLGLGPRWLPAAPLVTVLSLAGARETLFYITPALIAATGRAKLNLRFELGATALQVSCIVAGLPFGIFGVACGFALSGLALTPVLMRIQLKLTGLTLRQQAAAIWPGVHVSFWAAAAYLLVALAGWSPAATLVVGGGLFVVVAFTVFLSCHRAVLTRVISVALPLRMRPAARPSRRGHEKPAAR